MVDGGDKGTHRGLRNPGTYRASDSVHSVDLDENESPGPRHSQVCTELTISVRLGEDGR
jgi:hypothetical protein